MLFIQVFVGFFKVLKLNRAQMSFQSSTLWYKHKLCIARCLRGHVNNGLPVGATMLNTAIFFLVLFTLQCTVQKFDGQLRMLLLYIACLDKCWNHLVDRPCQLTTIYVCMVYRISRTLLTCSATRRFWSYCSSSTIIYIYSQNITHSDQLMRSVIWKYKTHCCEWNIAENPGLYTVREFQLGRGLNCSTWYMSVVVVVTQNYPWAFPT
jgi:hypothetical protein